MKELVLAFLLIFSFKSNATVDVFPIKNKQPLDYTLSKQEVLWMYTMKTRFWKDGTKVTVFYLANDTALHKKFCQQVLNMDTAKFDQLVSSYINVGSASYYRLAQTPSDVFYKVALTPGAIGYVDEATVIFNGKGQLYELKFER